MIQDTTPSVHAIMTHAGRSVVDLSVEQIRPLRGRAFVEMLDSILSATIVLPGEDPKSRTIHRGRVLSLGAPCLSALDHEIPWLCEPGDEVYFVLSLWLDKMRRMRILGVKGEVWCVGQVEVLARVER